MFSRCETCCACPYCEKCQSLPTCATMHIKYEGVRESRTSSQTTSGARGIQSHNGVFATVYAWPTWHVSFGMWKRSGVGVAWGHFKHGPEGTVMGLFQTSPQGGVHGIVFKQPPRPFWGIAICPVIRSVPCAAVPAPAPAVRCSSWWGSRRGAIPSALRCRKRGCSRGPRTPTGAGPAIGSSPRRAGAANCTPRNRRAERLCE